MIFLNNTLTRQKEEFKALSDKKVGIYACGPTVYWTQHIGNMRSVVIVDFTRRVFAYNGYDVNLVRNYTDVGHLTGDNIGDADTGEDRMAKAAKRENITPEEIAGKYIDIYNQDIALLNALPATHAPKATEHIQDMIDMVAELLKNGNAYITDQAVYFDVSTYPEYTKLSGQKIDKLESGEGHGVVSDQNKKHPQDFSIWFFKTGPHANALQTWESPFNSPLVENGRGFPGWHIECSAMSKHFLGKTFDIHMGGIEHIPIHHTNEIAQSVCANHADFAHYWMHNEHLVVDNKKMSKSEGTSYSVSDIIEKGFNPLALRYFFTQSHYRSKQNFTWEALTSAETALERLYDHFESLGPSAQVDEKIGKIDENYKNKFTLAINDDINIPQAVAILWELVKDSVISNADKKATVLSFDEVLGLGLNNIKKVEIEIPEEVQNLLSERALARKQNDFQKSDKLRDQIKTLGFEVKDTPEGQKVTDIK